MATDNKPIELSDSNMIDQKLNYLHNNPVEEEIVIESHEYEYKYSSAIDYASGKGLIDVVLI